MKTPSEYTKKLKNGIITKQMLCDALYSCNKRAKNYRDKQREYQQELRSNYYLYDKYDYVEQCREKKEFYYKQKEILLSVLKPVCIHKEHIRYERKRIYDYEPEYRKMRREFVWENCYFDRTLGREVWFGDIELYDKPIYFYYLFYDIGMEKTFHIPILTDDNQSVKEKLRKYQQSGLIIKEIDHLETEGHEITDLLSVQFVTKLVALVESRDFIMEDMT